MNKPRLSRNSVLTVVLMLGLAAISAPAQNKAQQPDLSPKEMEAIRAAVKRPAAATFWVVTQDFEGNFDSVDAFMAKFTEEAKRQGVMGKAQGTPNASPTGPIVILYEDPEGKSQFRMAVGTAISQKQVVKEPLKAVQMSFASAVRYTVIGPYENPAPVRRALSGLKIALREEQMKAGVEVIVKDTRIPFAVLMLYTDPKRVKAEQKWTEIILPVKNQ